MSVTTAMLARVGISAFRRLRSVAALAALLAAAGCSTLDPEGARVGAPAAPETPPASEGSAVPPAAPRTTGIETRAAADQRYVIGLFGGVYSSPATEAYLNGILAKLAAASDNPQEVYKVTLLNSPSVNAFALPSGDLFVTRGLLALANDSSEIAAVMAHEIGHVSARHAFQREEQQKIEQLRANVASTVQNRRRSEEIKATGLLNLASFSRQQELEADRIGIEVINRAGFDPYGAERFLKSLGRSLDWRTCQQDANSRRDQPDIMSSHPSTQGRVNAARLAARRIGAPGIGDAGRDAYLTAIGGVEFGDDPGNGLVRNRTFTHAKLGFAFTAPEGFSLENCSQAMIGVTSSRLEAVRLDIVQLSTGENLDTYIASGWVEGLKKDTIQQRTINGLQGAIAMAESNGWKFRVAVIRLNNEVARIIFAARNLPQSMDDAFVRSIESFQRLQSADIARVRAPRIAVIRARAGDSVESLSRRMAVNDRKLDLFLMLNGLQRGAALENGKRYKIISEL